MKLTFYILLISLISCTAKKSGPGSPKLETGVTKTIITKSITTSGGKIIVETPGELKGFQIDIPQNSYDDQRQFHITAAPILNHDLGKFFNPVSPLITITNGGGYSKDLMSVTVPVKVPPGHFAMGFLYNSKTGELEGLPLEESTPDHVTLYTRNFCHSTQIQSDPAAAGLYAEDIELSQIIIGSVDTSALMGDHITPFKPGIDDWNFTNWGSYIAPAGHCSGQSQGMMWYFSEKKPKGGPPLYTRFDNDDNQKKTPDFWRDDVLGYKFCSMLQNDWNWSRNSEALRQWQQKDDVRTFRAMAYAIIQTNQPQLLVIYSRDNKACHAVVCYGVSNGTMLIADPNRKGNTKVTIPFERDNRIYLPYTGGSKAGDALIQFTIFHYIGKTAVNSWTTATEHWKEVANKTIGKGAFPEFQIDVLNEENNFVPLTDGFVVPPGSHMTINVKCKGVPVDFLPFDHHGFSLLKEGSIINLRTDLVEQNVGINVIDTGKHWLGFKWFKVKLQKPPEQGRWQYKVKAEWFVDNNFYSSPKNIFNTASPGQPGHWYATGLHMDSVSVYIHGDDFHGTGTYEPNSRSGLRFGADHGELIPPGEMIITEWQGNNFKGSFDMKFMMRDAKVVRRVRGTFHDIPFDQ